MYRAWANGRHMQISELARGAGRHLPWLLVTGFGAHRLLSREVGLHVLENTDAEGRASRAAGRVRLAVPPLGDLAPDALREALVGHLVTAAGKDEREGEKA